MRKTQDKETKEGKEPRDPNLAALQKYSSGPRQFLLTTGQWLYPSLYSAALQMQSLSLRQIERMTNPHREVSRLIANSKTPSSYF